MSGTTDLYFLRSVLLMLFIVFVILYLSDRGLSGLCDMFYLTKIEFYFIFLDFLLSLLTCTN